MTIPPWFVKVLRECETLSLDNPRDRQLLWERICDAWPKDAMATAFARGGLADDVFVVTALAVHVLENE